MSPRDAADLEWPLSEGMQVSALPPVWIAMIISCWSVKLLKLPSVTLTHVCDTNSHNWWAKGLPGVGVVKIFFDSDSASSGWKSFRLFDSDSTALIAAMILFHAGLDKSWNYLWYCHAKALPPPLSPVWKSRRARPRSLAFIDHCARVNSFIKRRFQVYFHSV